MKGKRVRIGCAAASLLMGISGTYAYYRSSVETINKIAVGDVNIGIWEYEEDGDGDIDGIAGGGGSAVQIGKAGQGGGAAGIAAVAPAAVRGGTAAATTTHE